MNPIDAAWALFKSLPERKLPPAIRGILERGGGDVEMAPKPVVGGPEDDWHRPDDEGEVLAEGSRPNFWDGWWSDVDEEDFAQIERGSLYPSQKFQRQRIAQGRPGYGWRKRWGGEIENPPPIDHEKPQWKPQWTPPDVQESALGGWERWNE